MELENTRPDYILVIGASAGGWKAITEFVTYLPENAPVSILIILHISSRSDGNILSDHLQARTKFRCTVGKDGQAVLASHIYVAPSNAHMLIKNGKILLGHGPAESRWRPSIDVLFRSAAASMSNRAIGIVLSGMLADGAAGMEAIKKCGGTTIVQDPSEAEFPDMPMAVLEGNGADYSLPLSEMWGVIAEIIKKDPPPIQSIAPEVAAESRIAERTATSIENVAALGEKSLFSCPDCGGGLWEVENSGIARYRCHIGHSYEENQLAIKQSESIESTLWIALRMMEERYALLQKLSRSDSKKRYMVLASQQEQRKEETRRHIDQLKSILFRAG